MADTILTLANLESAIAAATIQILGLASNTDKVRISYPVNSMPAWEITDDVTFIQVTSQDDPITQQRDVEYTDKDTSNVNRIITYTRVHSVRWILYGPNSFDNADKLRNGLYLPTYKSLLAVSNLFLVLNVPSPTRFPELYNGQWWDRSDLIARFNEKVTRNTTVPYIKTTNISIESADITIEGS